MVGSPFKFPIHLGQWRDWPDVFFFFGGGAVFKTRIIDIIDFMT